jgi:hypothetical protein
VYDTFTGVWGATGPFAGVIDMSFNVHPDTPGRKRSSRRRTGTQRQQNPKLLIKKEMHGKAIKITFFKKIRRS